MTVFYRQNGLQKTATNQTEPLKTASANNIPVVLADPAVCNIPF